MKETVVRTHNLSFWYHGKKQVVQQVNLEVEKGAIYGFLGPNGAGKTTTIRLILGLLSPREGNVELFGKSLPEHMPGVFAGIGSLIEAPALYENLSGYDNLDINRRYRGLDRERMHEVLDLVRLGDSAHKRVKEYSLGMKQRLGLAIALLPDPPLLILDEPGNGLDPNGLIEIRELLLRLNKVNGTTILISSHLLSEIERIATHIGIINRGALLFQGTMDELQRRKAHQRTVLFRTDQDLLARSVLEREGLSVNGTEALRVAFRTDEYTKEMTSLLVREGLGIYEVKVEESDLESLFFDITEGEQ